MVFWRLRRRLERWRRGFGELVMIGLGPDVKALASSFGFDLVGITTSLEARDPQGFISWLDMGFAGEMEGYMRRTFELRMDPRKLFPEARSAIVVGMSYNSEIRGQDPPPLHGRISRYAWGMDYHKVLGKRIKGYAKALSEDFGAKATWYVDTGPVLEKEMAAKAGLGWIGKNTLLINPYLGSRIFLGVILTDMELPPDEEMEDMCGDCRICMEACPTGAITSPRVLDARRCISYLTVELKGEIPEGERAGIGDRVFGCDECQDACPWNIGKPRASCEEMLPRSKEDIFLDLLEALSYREGDFRAKFSGKAIRRAGRDGIARNAAVVLGNLGDRRAIPALSRSASEDPSPLVRAHSAWALGMLSKHPSCHHLSP
jgi:epoxyqueuosine reductase